MSSSAVILERRLWNRCWPGGIAELPQSGEVWGYSKDYVEKATENGIALVPSERSSPLFHAGAWLSTVDFSLKVRSSVELLIGQRSFGGLLASLLCTLI